jgi:hypothetical protein
MKLIDLRKVAIKKQQKIRFRLRNGMEGVVNELGVAQVPGLDKLPDFNLEQELEAASSFILEPLNLGQKNAPKPKTLTREEMTALVSAAPVGAAHHDEHDDE